MVHWIKWPFGKIYDLLKDHFRNKQIQEQTAIQQRALLLELTPQLDVSIHFVVNPLSPRRNDIPQIDVVIKNYGGATKILEGYVRFSNSQRPAHPQEKKLLKIQMPKGKEESFSFTVIVSDFHQAMVRQSIFKCEYELSFQTIDEEPQRKHGSYTFDPTLQDFVED